MITPKGRDAMSASGALLQDVQASRQSILARIADARVQCDKLFDLVRPEALYDRPIPERHRLIFYLGHLEAFDWNLIATGPLGLPAPRASLDKLFAFGIDPVDGNLPSDQPSDWPSLDQVRDYSRTTRRAMDEHLATFADEQLLHVALEHRLMHAETLAYLLHQLPLDRKYRASQDAFFTGHPANPHMVRIPAGTATLGMNAGDGFGWDNEFGQQTSTVAQFAIDAYNVTNGEFLDFVQAGGYQERSLWSEDAWQWIQQCGISHPGFWSRSHGANWRYRGMFEEIELPLDWPVYVSHAEASAYARFKGRELPTEAQYHRAAYGTPDGEENPYPWGHRAPEEAPGNFDFRRWDPAPVGAHPGSNSAFGVADLLGNGWEWTSTPFGPLQGFEPFPFYPGYSANFFDGKHFVMKGGSPRTAACMLRPSFRNWFQAQYPYIYTAFRCVEN
jgi:gamma-glutamyl hercynylcysteine S-oxide synthase